MSSIQAIGENPDPSTQTLRLEQAAAVTSKLSHDFGNYLTGIMGFTELSLMQSPNGSSQQRYLHEVLQSAKAGAEWIQRLHRFCRRTIPASVWPMSVDLAIADLQSNSPASPHLEISYDLGDDLPMVAIDAEALRTIFSELASNSRDALAGGFDVVGRRQTLTVDGARGVLGGPQPGEFVHLRVIDNGKPIDSAVRARLLNELFFSTKPKHRGLGLLVIYGLLKGCGGGMRLLTPNNGNGFGIELWLPVASLPRFDSPRMSPISSLVVLSDPRAATNLGRIMDRIGCPASVAKTSVDALEQLRSNKAISISIIETALPDESGLTLARRILELSPGMVFLFIHPQSSMHQIAEEELVKRFPVLRGALEPVAFFDSLQRALMPAKRNGR